jgi:hypothetical protein
MLVLFEKSCKLPVHCKIQEGVLAVPTGLVARELVLQYSTCISETSVQAFYCDSIAFCKPFEQIFN